MIHKTIRVICLLGAVFISGCFAPQRWDNATVLQLNAAGDVVARYDNAQIKGINGLFVPDTWIRLRTKDGRLITIVNAPYRIEYQ